MSLDLINVPYFKNSKYIRSRFKNFNIYNLESVEKIISDVRIDVRNMNPMQLEELKNWLYINSKYSAYLADNKDTYTRKERNNLLKVSKILSQLASDIERGRLR